MATVSDRVVAEAKACLARLPGQWLWLEPGQWLRLEPGQCLWLKPGQWLW